MSLAGELPWRLLKPKKAFDIRVLNLQSVTSFTDYFVICSVANIPKVKQPAMRLS